MCRPCFTDYNKTATPPGHYNRHASATSLARHSVVVSTYGLLAAKEAEIAPRSDRYRPEIAPGDDGGGDDATWRTKRDPSTCPTERRSCLHLLEWTRVILLDAEARACCCADRAAGYANVAATAGAAVPALSS